MRRFPGCFVARAISMTIRIFGSVIPPHKWSSVALIQAPEKLPDIEFTHSPERPHNPAALHFTFDQLDHYYRVPGEFTHRLTGDQYGFDALSFIITQTYPGGGPGLHVHDTEEAHMLLEGSVQYRIGDKTFTSRHLTWQKCQRECHIRL